MLKQSLFYSKILLFGEYGIIEDSMGLSIPFNQFKGALKIDDRKDKFKENSNDDINSFYEYLLELKQNNDLPCSFDLELMNEDIQRGLYFDSSIPQGFGVGSSGALVASVYDKYCTDRIVLSNNQTGDEIFKLKQIFGKLESYFHGKSSGLDPLICYLNIPILIKSKNDLDTVGLPEPNESGEGAIFLLDSGSPGQTQNMVSIFLEKCKNEGFRNLIKQQFNKHNNECIEAFLNKDIKPLFKSLKHLSQFVYDNFGPMIPDKFKKLWKEGIDSNSYYLKLCGSGGGGYILGFTENYKMAEAKLKGQNLQVIYQF